MVVCVLLVSAASGNIFATGDTLRVVTTGDSLTNGYDDLLQRVFNREADDATVINVARGGITSGMYTGRDKYGDDYLDFHNDVTAADPDAIVFMLGANDVAKAVSKSTSFQEYTENVPIAFDAFASYINGRGQSPVVIVMNLIPMITDRESEYEPWITDHFNPWIAQQAADRGFVHIDMWDLIASQPDWRDLYSDGIHLWGKFEEGEYLRTGQWLMAEAIRDELVPEPSALTVDFLAASIPEPSALTVDFLAVSIPEPSALAIVLLAGVSLLRRRRKA